MVSGSFKRKRKLMVAAPVFITPFLCLLFWVAGGGKGKAVEVEQIGINTTIPTSTNNQILGKDAAYQKILEDSLQKLKAEQENYVYTNQLYKPALGNANPSVHDESSDHVLSDVNKSLSSMTEEMKGAGQQNTPALKSPAEEYASQMKMTQDLLKADPAYQALMGELNLGNNKPDSLNAKLVAKQEEHFIPVQSEPETKAAIYTLAQNNTDKEQRFYNGIVYHKNRNGINTISAVVHDDQSVKEGTVVKLRLASDINLSGLIIPRNSFIYGVAQLQNERLNITVNSIAFGGSIYPVKLEVYDLDGLAGIKIPGSVNQAAAKQSTSDIINAGTGSTGVGSVTVNQATNATQQIASQITASAIESGKQLLVKKISEIKVFLKAGYHIYLKQSPL